MCSLPLLPGWFRAGCLAACCHSAPAASPLGPSTPSSGPSSPNTDEPPTPSTAAVTAATTHVLHAWGPEDAEALQHFLATTAAAASTASAVQLWTALLWHFAAEGRALAYARLTHTLTPILPPAVLHEPCTTITLPLGHSSRSLILSKMPVARSTKIRWSATGPSGFALAVQNTSEDRTADVADAPPVGAFIRNQSSAPQSLRFALGIMPEPTHVGGDTAAAAATAGRVVSTLAHLQRVFSTEGSLRAAVTELKGGPLPVFVKARHASFPPAKALGFKVYSGDPALMAAWKQCAPAPDSPCTVPGARALSCMRGTCGEGCM